MPVSVAEGVPDKILVSGSNFSHCGKSLMGLTLAKIVIGWLSGSIKRVRDSFAAKGIPYVAYRVFILSLMIGFELTSIPNYYEKEAPNLSVAEAMK